MAFYDNFISNLRNTSVGDFWKRNIYSPVSDFFSGGGGGSSFLDSYDKNDYRAGFSSLTRTKVGPEAFVKRYSGSVGRRIGPKTGFGFFDNILNKVKPAWDLFKGSGFVDAIGSGAAEARREQIMKQYSDIASRRRARSSRIGLDSASSMTPGFGRRDTRRAGSAFDKSPASKLAIEAALANLQIRQALLAQVTATRPNINVSAANTSIRTTLTPKG